MTTDDAAKKKPLSVLFVPLIFFIAVVLLLLAGLGKDPTMLDSTMLGKSIPKFNKTLLMDVNKVVSERDIQGPALVNVFGSWCPPCYNEHPSLMKLAETKAVKIYGVNYKDQRADALQFINKLGNPYEFIIADIDGRLGINLGVYGAPETFLISKDNKIIYRHVGIVNQKVWQEKLKPMLFPDPRNESE